LGRTHGAVLSAPRLLATFLLDLGRVDGVAAALATLRERAVGSPQQQTALRAADELEERLRLLQR
ncbi:MAG: hypothetical protein JNK15_11665, partial [Planctomycetes bacterium]|nr:hypothetical protein [Planctomycetota bacterium]